jgi:TetR/AcrR family transcriptional regulator, tetracycline repressor protein
MPAKRIDHRGDLSRGRPRHDGLTRDRVLAEALALIDRDGLEALTMRRLAGHLGVTPMALYNHVRDKQDLLQGVASVILTQVSFTSDNPDWRERIRVGFRELRRICLAHAGAARIMETVDVAPFAIFSLMEVTLAALEEIGTSTEEAMRAYFLLSNFTLGQVSYELRGPFPALNPMDVGRHQSFAEVGFPHVERAASIAHWDFDAAFEFGLSTILSGLERQPTT